MTLYHIIPINIIDKEPATDFYEVCDYDYINHLLYDKENDKVIYFDDNIYDNPEDYFDGYFDCLRDLKIKCKVIKGVVYVDNECDIVEILKAVCNNEIQKRVEITYGEE